MLRFSVLASGSSGNAAFLQLGETGVLIDAGIGPRQIASRLAAVGATWEQVNFVVLTHTHSDHWRERALEHVCRRKIPLYCHAEHGRALEGYSAAFQKMKVEGLVRRYDASTEFALGTALRCVPVEVSHDSVPTFAFRFAGSAGLFGDGWNLGFLSDLGCWSPALVEAFRNVDILALEFNHDEVMERQSRRPAELISRVLGDYGHLSNDQAAAFLSEILDQSTPGTLQHVVQLHLSRECNRPSLAQKAAMSACARAAALPEIHTAHQDYAGPKLTHDTCRVAAKVG